MAQIRFLNGEIHDWYRIIWGYSDHLVAKILSEYDITSSQRVFDPFCGAGTTLVECKKVGVQSIGVDANPSSVFATKVKTNWKLNPERIRDLLKKVEADWSRFLEVWHSLKLDPTYHYLLCSGMLERGWISEDVLLKSIALKRTILSLPTIPAYKNVLMLALLDVVVHTIANVKFGPELYCSHSTKKVSVWKAFEQKVTSMINHLELIGKRMSGTQSRVIVGDSRECYGLLKRFGDIKFDSVITSPPYPSEHDYTRNARLELAFLEMVTNKQTLREIKAGMLRSHTKGIYKNDNDSLYVDKVISIQKIVKELEPICETKNYGFARLYPKVVTEYFGGMRRHFQSLGRLLKKGAVCAYVVGDQSSYFQVHIQTAELLGILAEMEGFRVIGMERWRSRFSTKTSKSISENILYLRYNGNNFRKV